MVSLASIQELKVARLNDIEAAHELKSAAGRNTVSLRRVLENARLDYVGAVHFLSGENPIETARLTGLDPDKVLFSDGRTDDEAATQQDETAPAQRFHEDRAQTLRAGAFGAGQGETSVEQCDKDAEFHERHKSMHFRLARH